MSPHFHKKTKISVQQTEMDAWSSHDPLFPSTYSPSSQNGSRRPSSTVPPPPGPPVLCAWGIGWQTPTSITVPYIFAVILAVVHYIFFQYLNGKSAAGQNQVISQTYVSTISHILATAFQTLLQFSLGIAFVQHLWYLLRNQTLRVSTIEKLFSLRSSPYLMCAASVLQNAPSLVCLVAIIWAIYGSTGFPPGAITVEQVLNSTTTLMTVPTFDASFMGNGSGVEANVFSLVQYLPWRPDAIESSFLEYGQVQPFAQRMANSVLSAGTPTPMASPCGANCSYAISFDGPWFQCNYSHNHVAIPLGWTPPIFESYWNTSQSDFLYSFPTAPLRTGPTLNTPFEIYFIATTLSPKYGPEKVYAQSQTMTCLPSRIRYTLHNSYQNNVQVVNISTTGANPKLIDLWPAGSLGIYQNITGILDGDGQDSSLGWGKAQWNQQSIDWYRDNNLMSLIALATNTLLGGYVVVNFEPLNPGANLTNANGTDLPFGWLDVSTSNSRDVSDPLGPVNGTLVGNSRFNNYLNTIQPQTETGSLISFNITEESLNSLMKNITLTAITAYNFWNTTTNVTTHESITVYSFSKPRNLILAYGLTLLISLPFIILGLWALYTNKVPAIDGGFVQLISTSTGSAALSREAAGGCLGGKGNVPKGLENLKIRFGELRHKTVDEDSGMERIIRRAGFGTDEEVMPLRKGAEYGLAHPDR